MKWCQSLWFVSCTCLVFVTLVPSYQEYTYGLHRLRICVIYMWYVSWIVTDFIKKKHASCNVYKTCTKIWWPKHVYTWCIHCIRLCFYCNGRCAKHVQRSGDISVYVYIMHTLYEIVFLLQCSVGQFCKLQVIYMTVLSVLTCHSDFSPATSCLNPSLKICFWVSDFLIVISIDRFQDYTQTMNVIRTLGLIGYLVTSLCSSYCVWLGWGVWQVRLAQSQWTCIKYPWLTNPQPSIHILDSTFSLNCASKACFHEGYVGIFKITT